MTSEIFDLWDTPHSQYLRQLEAERKQLEAVKQDVLKEIHMANEMIEQMDADMGGMASPAPMKSCECGAPKGYDYCDQCIACGELREPKSNEFWDEDLQAWISL